jgi:hypothetical protein
VLPVYEIYKVGADPYWVNGLDVLGRWGYDLTIVPHWNNNSGSDHDTTHCFVGRARFERLRAQLPVTNVVLGIDEYTACTLLFQEGVAEVQGAGSGTIMRAGDVRVIQSGERFELALLANGAPTEDEFAATRRAFAERLSTQPHEAISLLQALIERQQRAGNDASVVRDLLAELAVGLRLDSPNIEPITDNRVPLIELLITLRQKLHASKQYALADEVRVSLAQLGITLEDTASGTTWHD